MIIYVAGYQKSGTTWITRLLGDVLDCKTGGSLPKEDQREIATEGLDRNWNTTVRKGHFILSDQVSLEPVTQPHVLKWQSLRSEEHRVVFVVRDPRDIAVSAAHHWNIPVDSSMRNMALGTNNFRHTGPWTAYIDEWIHRYDQFVCAMIHYEDMLKGPQALANLLARMNFVLSEERIPAAYERQSFANRLADVKKNGHEYPLGKEFNLRFMRKGIAGDWRNHFNRTMAFDAETYFGDLLRFFLYESDAHWWKEL